MSEDKFFVWRSSESAYICRRINDTQAECVAHLYGPKDGRTIPFLFLLRKGGCTDYVIGEDDA